jgi:hypothetical protein
MLDSAWEDLAVSQKWAAAWKALAKRCRGMILKEMVEMQDLHRQLQRTMDNARNNPGLLLAALVFEANKDGVEIGSRAAECMGWAFEHYLSNHPEAPNYLEVTLEGGDHKPIYITIQRPGGKTPHQLRREAEGKLAFAEDAVKAHVKFRDELLAERDKLRAELEGLKAQGECRS